MEEKKKTPSSAQEHVCPVIQGLAMQDNMVSESVSVLILQLFCSERLTHSVNQLGAVKLRFYKYAMLFGMTRPLTSLCGIPENNTPGL